MKINDSSQELFYRSLRVAPGGVHSPVRSFKGVGGEPIFFRKARGATIESVDGATYIDFCQSFGPNILGHLDPDVLAEVRQAIEEAWSFGACEPYSLALAEKMIEHNPFVDKVRFVCSGTEAVMSALRVARAATKRSLVLKFDGCYHGHADQMLVKAGSGLAGLALSDSAGVPEHVAGDTLICPLDDDAALESVFSRHGKDIAVICMEPLPANYGLLIQRDEFIKKAVTLARQYGALVLFDEVISGFRVGFGGMAGRLGITPDLVTYGKVIGGGFPVGAYAGKKELMDLVAPLGPVYQAGTLAASPVGMRAGLATLDKLEKAGVFAKLDERMSRFREHLQAGFAKQGVPLKVSSFASLFWIHEDVGRTVRSPKDFSPTMKETFARFFNAALAEGVYLAPSAFEIGFLSLAHDDGVLSDSCDRLLNAAEKAFGK